jgi:hypothetical protein
MTVPLTDYASLGATEREALAATLGPLTSLERVLRWAGGLTPPRDIDEILTQDEYTHDVGIRLDDTRYLVFDTT